MQTSLIFFFAKSYQSDDFFSIMSTQAWGQTLLTLLATPKDQISKKLPINVLLGGAYLFLYAGRKTSWQSLTAMIMKGITFYIFI